MWRKCLVNVGLFVVLAIIYGCTPVTMQYKTDTLDAAKTYFSVGELPPYMPEVGEKEEAKDVEMDRYRAILEQEYKFEPPVRILLIAPRKVRYYWTDYPGYSTQIDSVNAMLYRALSEKFAPIQYVDDVLWSSPILGFGTLDKLREMAAYYRADEVLLVSYNLTIRRPASCCGFWPSIHLTGSLQSETMLIDTRTGFFLTGRLYQFSSDSTESTGIYQSTELELMRSIVDLWTDAIVSDILDFYEQKMD
jgi:hypothetical protein